jgi:hypothetical protein
VNFFYPFWFDGRSQCPRGLRRRSAAARLLRLWVRIPLGGMDVCRECCVLSGRGLCDELITRPEESYWVWCVVVCNLETSWMRRPWPTGGCCAADKFWFDGTKWRIVVTGHTMCNMLASFVLVCTLCGLLAVRGGKQYRHLTFKEER